MSVYEAIKNRRSVRKYTGEAIEEAKINQIVEAGLLSPSGRHINPWELILVRDKNTLAKLSESRVAGAAMLKDADACIVVVANTDATDVWTEDCSIVMAYMHLMADSLGVGSCWIQGRLRDAQNQTTDDYLRALLGYPDNYSVEAMLSLGMPEAHPEPRSVDDELLSKLHREKF